MKKSTGLVGVAGLTIAIVLGVYLLQPENPTGEWRDIDGRESQIYFAAPGDMVYSGTGWFRDSKAFESSQSIALRPRRCSPSI